MKMEKIWIRRSKTRDDETEISHTEAKIILRNYYSHINEAMAAASEKMPLTTGFADYWPKEGGGGNRKRTP